MDFVIWASTENYNEPRKAIWDPIVQRNDTNDRYKSFENNCMSSRGKWLVEHFHLQMKTAIKYQETNREMGRSATNNNARHTNSL